MFDIDLTKLIDQFRYHPDQPLLFTSGLFLFLFIGFLLIYIPLSHTHRPKLIFTTLFSLYFYYKSSGIFVLLLLSTICIDFMLAKLIHKNYVSWKRSVLLTLSLISNLGMLCYFKYTNFLHEIFSYMAGLPFQPFDIFLPVGVSFFTFQSLSYTIDVYRKRLRPSDHLLDYAFFVSFFPQLVAGPIVRASEFLPQLEKPTFVSQEMLGRGIFLIGTGLFKKAVISNYISANFVDRIFESPALFTGLENLLGVYGYALQIYCDFSGYSDMAIGLALLLGFHFNDNFNAPYTAKNITEFWRRWHISLSTWLRDYLYISLGGNRHGKIRTYVNLIITMLLGGLWHGASFRFLLWGGLHGIMLAIHKFILESAVARRVKLSPVIHAISPAMGCVLTFHFVCFGWIFFRSPTMEHASQMINQILFHFSPLVFFEVISGYWKVIALIALGYVLHFIPRSMDLAAEQWTTRLPLAGKAVMLLLIIIVCIQTRSASIQPFIYFQF
jgi:D-alanyl-lipoteichoic acid acyltransferase DltB (MBOAT superfamily)